MAQRSPDKMTTNALYTAISDLRPQARAIRKEAVERWHRINDKIQDRPESPAIKLARMDLAKLTDIITTADEIIGNTNDD